ncbi:MAG: hypothetical protein IJE81_06465 [Oscillospiraceae bacterium]|nr:hypothetical protein [Oscillospiraceae bacterium]
MALKRYFALFAVMILMLCALPLTAAAGELSAGEVKTMVEELPDVSALTSMTPEEQTEVYDRTQAVYDAYQTLTEEERAGLEGAEETFDALFSWFNAQVMPLEEAAPAEEPAEEKAGIPWHYTALLLALIATVLQNRFILNRRR